MGKGGFFCLSFSFPVGRADAIASFADGGSYASAFCFVVFYGKCFEYEEGRMVRECEYKNGVMMRVLREWKGECMIEYDVNGIRVYEGEFEGDMMKGFVREGEGKEYGIGGERFDSTSSIYFCFC